MINWSNISLLFSGIGIHEEMEFESTRNKKESQSKGKIANDTFYFEWKSKFSALYVLQQTQYLANAR